MRTPAIVLAVVASISTPTHAQTPMQPDGLDPTTLAEITDAVAAVVDRDELAGSVVAVSRHGQMAYLQATGLQDIDTRVPMQDESIFRIYSMSRAITAVAVGTLVDAGRLSFDDPVHRYLPAFADVRVRQEGGPDRAPSRPITVRDLLLHTAGLNFRNAEDYRAAEVRSRARSLDDFVTRLASLPLYEDPGTRFRYGTASTIAGAVVEAAAGQPLDEYMREAVLDPLGMSDTGFWVPPEKVGRLATPYRVLDGGGLEAFATEDVPFTRRAALIDGAVGMLSTAPDFLRFCQMLLDGGELDGVRVLSEATTAELIRNGLSDEILATRRGGRGWSMANASVRIEDGDAARAGEFTWNGSVGADFWVDPTTQTIVVTMWQSSPANPSRLRQQILDIVRRAIR
ncbi:MAG: serine hydrolase domain-containing protein [Gemmatimonadota bacterium]